MKAWRLHQYGAPIDLRLEDVPEPVPGPAEVLIRVQAIGLNSSELQLIRGEWAQSPLPPYFPFSPGLEAAGEIVALGSGVASHRLGERVTIHYLFSCGRCDECLSGWENTCTDRVQFGRNIDGSYRELIAVPAEFAIPLPPGVNPEAAVALTTTAGTAWHMLVVHGGLQPAETVLITGGASGIGTAAIQVARLAGARVIATAGHPEKLERMRALGADLVINHNENPDFSAQVIEFLGGRKVDVVYEVPGAATFGPALATLRPRGRLIVGGYQAGRYATIDLIDVIRREVRIYGSATWNRPTLRKVLALTDRGLLAPIVDSVFPFAALPEGLEKMERRDLFGKIVVALG